MSSPEKRAIGGELVIPVVAVAFTIYYFVSIHDAPWTAKVSTYFIGGILIGLSVVFALLAGRAVLSGRATLSLRTLTEPEHLRPKRLGLLVLTIGYVFALDWGGFTITTFCFLLAGMLVLGGALVARTALALSAAYALGGYVLFIVMFQTRFPAGPLERLLAPLLG